MTRLPAKTRGPVRVNPTRAIDDGSQNAENDDGNRDRGGHAESLKLLRFPAVRERTGLSRSTIWRLERQGAFPKHHRISANAVAWVEDEIVHWIRSKVTGIAV
jgi:prophage regulatory protein